MTTTNSRWTASSGLRRAAAQLLLVTAISTGGMMLTPAAAQAQSVRSYDIAAGSLATALNLLVQTGGIALVYDSALTQGLSTQGLKGTYGEAEALSRLLAGSGLTYRQTGPHAFTLEHAPSAAGSTVELGPVRVDGSGPTSTSAPAQAEIGTLPPAYAGGQVARGARMGLLGNRDYMDTPYSITSYTEKSIRDQQAQSIADVLTTSDPSVRASIGSGNRYDALTIRGFRVDNDELALNGLYGLVPAYRIGPDPVERIELLKGGSALLNGMLPFGSVGGTVNIVTKRAEDTPLTRVAVEYMSDAWFGGHVDVGRRFGEGDRFGIRVNGAFRDGDTTIDNQTRRNGSASLGFDYRGDRLRLSADIIYQDDHFRRAARGYAPAPGIVVPAAPDPRINLAQSFDYGDSTSLTALGRAEFDIVPDVTLFAAVGGTHFAYNKQEDPGATILDTAGNARSLSRYQQGRTHSLSAEAGIRAHFSTGGIDHLLVVSGNSLDQKTWFGQTTYPTYTTNIYNPVFLSSPGTPVSSSPETRDSGNKLQSIAIADTLSVRDGLVQLTVGVRRQQVETSNFAASGQRTAHYDEGATTPSFALTVRPSDRLSFYANYIEALSAGASPPADAANPNQIFAPYKSKQYEVGTKLDLGNFGATLGLFRITVPSGIVDPFTKVYSLDGEQRHRGVELNGFGELGSGIRLLGGATWLDAKLRKTQNNANDGHHAVGAPSFQANLGAEWDTAFVPGLTVTGRMIHTSEAYTSTDDIQHVPSWTRFDLGLRYASKIADKAVVLRANVTNLFDKYYWESNPSGYLISGMPRTLWLSLSTDF